MVRIFFGPSKAFWKCQTLDLCFGLGNPGWTCTFSPKNTIGLFVLAECTQVQSSPKHNFNVQRFWNAVIQSLILISSSMIVPMKQNSNTFFTGTNTRHAKNFAQRILCTFQLICLLVLIKRLIL